MKTMNSFAVIRALTGTDGTADLASMDLQELRVFLRGVGKGRALLAALEAEAVARIAGIEGPGMAEVALSCDARLSPAQSRTVVQRAHAIGVMPRLGAALEDGDITPDHVDAVARGVKRLGDKGELLVEWQDRLLAQAMCLPIPRFATYVDNIVGSLDRQSENEVFEHQRRTTQVKLWEDHRSGMIRLAGQFDPERGSRLWSILDSSVDAIFHSPAAVDAAAGVDPNDHRRGLALCHLVEAGADHSLVNGPDLHGPLATGTGDSHVGDDVGNFFDKPDAVVAMGLGNQGSRVGTEVIVTIDLQTLLHGLHSKSVRRTGAGVNLPVDVIRRMACDAGLVPMVLNSEGVVVDVGRSKRLATRRQRRAIFAMHDTCAAPHCGVKVKHCVPHHIDWWEHGGGTDLSNLVPLCSRHHHAVHEGGWRLSMDSARTVTMTRPGEHVH